MVKADVCSHEHRMKIHSVKERAMSYQCQNEKCMCVTQKAKTTCLSDSIGTYFICSVCTHKTYIATIASRGVYAHSSFDRRAIHFY